MEAKYRVDQSGVGGPMFVVAGVAAMLLLAVVISAAVVYFIGATLPYTGSPDYAPPIDVGSLVGVSTAVDVAQLPVGP